MRARAALLLVLALPALAGCDVLDAPSAQASEPATSEAAAQPTPPLELTGRVVDAADIFDEQTEGRLTEELAALEEEVGPQMVVVSTPSLEGRDIKDYAMSLGNSWGIGDAKRNDGLLLVVAPNERKVRIELGLGTEKILSNELCADIIENDILPRYREGDLAGGTLKGVKRLDSELRNRLKEPTA